MGVSWEACYTARLLAAEARKKVMDPTEAMEDYEFIDKRELEEADPPKPTEMASSAASSASIVHDRITHLQNLNTEEEEEEGTDVEVSGPVSSEELCVDHALEVGLPISDSLPGDNQSLNGHFTVQIHYWALHGLVAEVYEHGQSLSQV